MNSEPHFQAWREWLLGAGLAVLGGFSSLALTRGGPALCTAVALPGGLQSLSGLHVLPLILAAGLIRRPGAATFVGLAKGAIELLVGNAHGPFVLIYAGLAGLVVDLVFLLLSHRRRLVADVLAGGLGTASNIFILACVTALPNQCRPAGSLLALAGIAFVSGSVLAGGLGWAMLWLLRRAGIRGLATRPASFR